jgi:hypothetical protein
MTQSSKNYSLSQVGNILSVDANGAITSINASTTGANLGAVGNVHITGGSNGQVLTTNGSGNLNWSTPAATSVTYGSYQNNGTGFTTVTAGADEQNPQKIFTFTIPSAGVWDVSYSFRIDTGGGAFCGGISIWNDTTNTYIPDSTTIFSGDGGNTTGTRLPITARFVMTTTAATTYKVCAFKPLAGYGITADWFFLQQAGSNVSAQSKVWWFKIG